MFAIGILIYRDTTKPRDRIGAVGMWAFIIFLAAFYVVNASGTPPPNDRRAGVGRAVGLALAVVGVVVRSAPRCRVTFILSEAKDLEPMSAAQVGTRSFASLG